MKTYYNEIDPYPAQWLRNLAEAGEISGGCIDERSIEDIKADELEGYDRAHFFAGIGGWELALRLAGWPPEWEVWTGSCPCQPFSQAGKGKGMEDERHLWPVFYRLIEQRRPPAIFGEQTDSPLGRAWLAGVRADMEALGYAFGCADLCAASVGAPHPRQRLWWVAYANGLVPCSDSRAGMREGQSQEGDHAGRSSEAGGVANPSRKCRDGSRDSGVPRRSEHSDSSGMGDTEVKGLQGHTRHELGGSQSGRIETQEDRQDLLANPWGGAEWVYCLDEKTRRIKPGLAPLAHGIPSRVGKIRAYGNAIVPQIAAEFIKAAIEVRGDLNL